jgi:hypothetical protein
MTQKRKNENDVVVSGNSAAARRKAARPRAKHSITAEPTVVPVSAAPEIAPSVPNFAAPVADAVPSLEPAYDEVARLAYSYWEARGCQGGSAEEDWLRAEKAVRGAAIVA